MAQLVADSIPVASQVLVLTAWSFHHAGHYKYPPAEIPALLIQSGANLEAKDSNGRTALQVALLSGWQNIAELLIKSGAQTGGVPDIKASITCPDCKRIVATYNL